jgi:glucosamine--fructose-6-phosphate aminotransferase (isomerizing)
LSRLEYRGYDSAGLAVLRPSASFSTHKVKAIGKLSALRENLEGEIPLGVLGLGHTRWATHGVPNLPNTHPHLDCSGRIAVVQNGIVENYRALKADLAGRGHRFASQTDTEVVPHLIEEAVTSGLNLEGAIRQMLRITTGALALLVANEEESDTLVAVRSGNAGGLVFGLGDGETFVASNMPALVPLTSKVVFMNAAEMVSLSANGIRLTTLDGETIHRDPTDVAQNSVIAAEGEFDISA